MKDCARNAYIDHVSIGHIDDNRMRPIEIVVFLDLGGASTCFMMEMTAKALEDLFLVTDRTRIETIKRCPVRVIMKDGSVRTILHFLKDDFYI